MNDPTSPPHRNVKRRVRPGIYLDRYSLLAIVSVRCRQETARFAADEDLDRIEAWRLEARAKLKGAARRPQRQHARE
jgi:hypothetical protein